MYDTGLNCYEGVGAALTLDEQRSGVSPRSRLRENLAYIANRWEGLLVFLDDERVKMDSNFVENRIRPVKLTAKHAVRGPVRRQR